MGGRTRLMTLVTAIVATGGLGAPATAQASLCGPSAGPIEYQAKLGPMVGGFVLAPSAPGSAVAPSAPPASTGIGAATLAREALGRQYAGVWLSNALQGWVVGLAPGALDRGAARVAITDRIAGHYTAGETAYLSERLHVDQQPYGDADLTAVQDAVAARLLAVPGLLWGGGIGCSLSDARRVEVTIYQPATPEQVLQVIALVEQFGDTVRLELSSRGAPAPAIGLPPPVPPPRVVQQRVAFFVHVKMPVQRRCIAARHVRISARAGSPAVKTLTVRSGGRTRTISGKRLAKPLVVTLRARRTTVAVTVRLADGRAAGRTVTYTRCR